MTSKTALAVVAAGVLAMSVLSGCGEKKPDRKLNTIKGTALSINPSTGQVSMRWYQTKKQMYREVAGEVTEETEVLINGRLARLEDVRVGDPVEVVGYQDGQGLDARFVAVRIIVPRDDLADSPEQSESPAPTTQPAR